MNFPLVKCNWACLRMPFGSAFYPKSKMHVRLLMFPKSKATDAEEILVEEK